MNYLDWHVGMKMVCVDDRPVFGVTLLHVGQVYTIAKIGRADGMFCGTLVIGQLVIALVEQKSICKSGIFHDDGFAVQRFRPVEIRKTDISIFTAMLHGEKVDA